MARLFFGMNVSLDGYVDHDAFGPGEDLFRHFIGQTAGLTGSLYGRGLYEVMRYWDEDQPGWDEPEREFARAWRANPKWVASNTLTEVGPNATLVRGDALEATVRRLKDELPGEIEVGGPVLAHSLGQKGLVDEYRLYYRPFVLGRGAPLFRGALPPLRLVANDRVGEDAVRLTYVPT